MRAPFLLLFPSLFVPGVQLRVGQTPRAGPSHPLTLDPLDCWDGIPRDPPLLSELLLLPKGRAKPHTLRSQMATRTRQSLTATSAHPEQFQRHLLPAKPLGDQTPLPTTNPASPMQELCAQNTSQKGLSTRDQPLPALSPAWERIWAMGATPGRGFTSIPQQPQGFGVRRG